MSLEARLASALEAVGADIKALVNRRGAANGTAPLNAQGIVPLANLPSLGGGSDPWSSAALLANSVPNTTVTLTAVTGLSFTAAALTEYWIDIRGAFQSAATTTGIAIALDVPTGSTQVDMQTIHNVNATTLGGNEQIADNATTGATAGVRAANTRIPFRAYGQIKTGAVGGTVQLMFRSEIAASAVTILAGTRMAWRAW